MKSKKIKGENIYYEDKNSEKQEVILLIHGHPFDHSMWRYQHEVLNEYRLIIPDLRGYGKSISRSDRIFIEDHALDMTLLLDELNIQKVHLIGLSMGGQVVIEYLRLFKGRVNSMILCATSPKSETEESYKKRLQLAEILKIKGMLSYTKKCIHEYINISENDVDSHIYKHLFHMMANTPEKGAIASHRGRAERRDNFKFLSSVDKPTLVVAGENDHFFKVKDVKEVADEIPNSNFEIIRKSGHLPNMEKSSHFNKLITNFYKDLT